MAFLLADRVGETSTTIGTGTLTLLGASTGCRTFLSGIGSGNTCYYSIVNPRTSEWEEGIGTVVSGTLERTTVTNSSNADTLVNFKAGTKNVVVSLPAGKLVYKNAAGNVSLPNQTTLSSTDSMLPSSLPSLNLDFVNSGQLDPRITFARNSTAAYYDGKSVAKAEENLLLYSQDFSQTAWTKPNSSVAGGNTAPDTSSTAYKLVINNAAGAGTGYIIQSITGIAFTNTGILFNLTTGLIGSYIVGTFDSTPTCTSVGNSWYRCTVFKNGYHFSVYAKASEWSSICIQVVGTQMAIYPSTTSTAISGTGDGTSGVFLWGAQLEQRSAVTAYTPTTTSAITNYIPVLKYAAAGVPRFDYDPVTSKPLGLLIEEGRSNYLVGSNTPTTQPVGASPPTVTTESIVLPDGTIGMCSKVLFASSGDTRVRVPAYGTWSGNYYFSVFYKVSGDLGWKKYSGAAAIAASLLYFDIGYSGLDGSSWYGKTVYFTFGQLEAGSFATSYIPTIGQTVGRFADQVSMTGTNFSSWYNQSQGAIYCEYDFIGVSSVNGLGTPISLNDNSLNNRIRFNVSSATNVTYEGVLSAASQWAINATVTSPTKLAGSYVSNSINFASNGTINASDTLASIPLVTQLQIGNFLTNRELIGHIRKLSYYPRALSSSELQGLTK